MKRTMYFVPVVLVAGCGAEGAAGAPEDYLAETELAATDAMPCECRESGEIHLGCLTAEEKCGQTELRDNTAETDSSDLVVLGEAETDGEDVLAPSNIYCDWSGKHWISHGWDGGCAWSTGAWVHCTSNRITSIDRVVGGCGLHGPQTQDGIAEDAGYVAPESDLNRRYERGLGNKCRIMC